MAKVCKESRSLESPQGGLTESECLPESLYGFVIHGGNDNETEMGGEEKNLGWWWCREGECGMVSIILI